MNLNLYNRILKGRFDLSIGKTTQIESEVYVQEGVLVDRKTGKKVLIKNYIPRFVEDDNYTNSFGYQWDKFRNLQHDSVNRKHLSAERVFQNTKWKKEDLKNKIVLECGTGPGRFTEILQKTDGIIIAVDMSGAIDVNLDNIGLHSNLLYIQDDITNLYYMRGKADYIFCYGVLQHTPNPPKTLHRLVQYAKWDGKISIDVYKKYEVPSPFYGPKYFWRPITKKVKPESLLKILKWYIPKYIGFDTFLRKLSLYGKPIGYYILGIIPIPCWNYIDMGYSKAERIQHAIMDTFDALSPMYDYPCSMEELRKLAERENFKKFMVFYGSNGLVLNAVR